MRKEIVLGFLIGLVANLAGMFIYVYFFLDYEFIESLKIARLNDTLGNLIALGAILNLLVFFTMIKKKQLYRARGVLMATILAALAIMYLQF